MPINIEAISVPAAVDMLLKNGIKVSERALREKAREKNAFRQIGRAMFFTRSDLDYIMQSDGGFSGKSTEKVTAPEGVYISEESLQIVNDMKTAKKKVNHKKRFYPSWLAELARGARARAKQRGREFSLTATSLIEMHERASGHCEVSGIPFDSKPAINNTKRPFAPSIDRIDASKGYTPTNTRLVCFIVNVAMNEWGDAPLHKLVEVMSAK